MAYRIRLKEQPGEALVRIGLEQLELALKSLRHADATAGVHGARKCIKRLRALLRLARPGLVSEAYRSLNAMLRDAGRALSATRDQDVLSATLAGLAAGNEHLKPSLAPSNAHPARPARARTTEGYLRDARKLLLTARDDWRHLALNGDGLQSIENALARGMRDMRDASVSAHTRHADEEAFHDLRKSVQRHWRQMRVLEAAWPDYFNARAEEAKAISELLGRAQDLGLVLRHLEQSADASGRETADLAASLEAQRADLREEASIRLRRLLDEKPKAHARRIAAYWTAAQRLRKTERAEVQHAAAAAAAAARVDRPPAKRSAPSRTVRRKASPKRRPVRKPRP